MDFASEIIALWKKQYFAMLQIQFPEFFRSAIELLNSFFSYLSISRANRFISISKSYFPDEQQNKDVVHCEVLYTPPPEMHRADIIIIHGLHGSTYKTWRQGVYKCEEVKKFQLRQHIPLSSDAEKSHLCKKCNVTTKNSESVTEKEIQFEMESKVSSQDNHNLYESVDPDDNVSTYDIFEMNNLTMDEDDILYSNIDLIRNSFCGSKTAFGERIDTLTDDVAQSDANFLILDDSFVDDFCDCILSRNMDNFRSGKGSEIFCDSDVAVNNQYTYSSTRKINALDEICLNCKKKQKFETATRLPKSSDDQNCFISCSFESISDEFFEEFDQRTNHNSYEYDGPFSNTRLLYEENIVTEIRRQSIQFLNDSEYSEDDSFSNNFNETQQVHQNNNNCKCMAKEMNNTSIYKEDMSYAGYLRYADIYGNSPRLLKELFFIIRFIFSFAKEAYSLYRKLWDYSNRSEELSRCWPQDWLPIDCPYARVISINYSTFLWKPIWTNHCQRTSLQEKSLEMARQLERLGVGEYPIVWAAHSKGGLFVKQMFINSWRRNSGVSAGLFSSTDTMVFYSVPQHGSILAHFFTSPFVIPSIEIMEIRTGSQMLRQLQIEFREALKASKEDRVNSTPPTIISYTETIPTNMSGVLLQIVFPTSADPGVGELYGIPLDHRMICKFASRDSVLYKDLVELVERAHKTIA